jgi:ethanolaminephosphotransferase
MLPKQQEMDGIVRELFEAMKSKPHLESTLLVLCGDHGMNDAGNHGASSPGETSPALVFMSPRMKQLPSKNYAVPAVESEAFKYYSLVEQSDLAPTMAALLGFPIPKNNLGAFIPEFLPLWASPQDNVQILVRNARQILNIVTAAFGETLFDQQGSPDPCHLDKTEVNELACDWRKISRDAHALAAANELDEQWVSGTMDWLRKAQDLMSSMASNYDMSKLVLGQGLAVVALLCSVSAAVSLLKYSKASLVPLSAIAVSYGIMMFASSYVEEEQHFWYWTSTLWLTFVAVRSLQRYVSQKSIFDVSAD